MTEWVVQCWVEPLCWNSDSEGGKNGIVWAGNPLQTRKGSRLVGTTIYEYQVIVIVSQSVIKVKHRVRSAKDFNSSSEIFRHIE
jgi:hypothetical protein